VINPSPVVAWSRKITCPDCSPAERHLVLQHLFEHVPVAHRRRDHVDAVVVHRSVEPDVRHDGRDDAPPVSVPSSCIEIAQRAST
jgi:hypothetical protein